MKCNLKVLVLVVGVGTLLLSRPTYGQITINELVEDEQDFESTDVADTREFIELYNAGATAVNIEGWKLNQINLTTGGTLTSDILPAGASIPAGGYYVIGQSGVPNVNFTPAPGELWTIGTAQNVIFELRNPTDGMIDALGVDTFRGVELAMATQAQLDQIGGAGQTPGATAKGGWWGQLESNNANAPNIPLSLGRYLNGRDTNRNGLDFGLQPVTPGASNNQVLNASHTVPNVDALADGTALGTAYGASFVLPKVITPGSPSGGLNPNNISASPQGSKAIIAYDTTGGGNAVVSKELVNKFDIYAFIDPRPLKVTTADASPSSEATVYGIGTTDPFFGTPNSADLLTGNPGGNVDSSANGSTGLGWLIQRRELFNTSTLPATDLRTTKTVLQLIDFNDGGDGVKADNDWQIIQEFDLTGTSEGWHRLSVEYTPGTGAVLARYDNQVFPFNSLTGMVGNFYVGWRENLPGVNNAAGRPPTYDLYVAPTLTGDYNGNGKVDAADYVLWRNDPASFGGTGGYDTWRANFGNPPGSGSGAGAVPEPATVSLLVFVAAFAGWRRRS